MNDKPNFSQFSRKQLEAFAGHLWEVNDVQLGNNNALLIALQNQGLLSNDQVNVLNQWSLRSNHISEKSREELARIAADRGNTSLN